MKSRARRALSRFTLSLTLPFLSLSLGGCRLGGDQSASEANDDLRRRVIELEKQLQTLQGEREELKTKLAESERTREGALPPEALEALPRCTAVEIGSFSGFEPADPAKPAGSVVAYLTPTDGRGRFVQIVGTMKVAALVLPASLESAGGGASDQVLATAERTYSPAELREAYRSGVAGTHYLAEIPLEKPISDRGAVKVLIRAEFLDAITGKVHKAELVKPTR